MSVFTIPTSTTLQDYKLTADLDGVLYELRFRWNERLEAWLLDVYDATGVLLIAGRRCSADGALLAQHKHLAPIGGELLVFDTTLRRVDPKIDDFGTRVLMLYVDAAELAAIALDVDAAEAA